jgi:hypothetical protein
MRAAPAIVLITVALFPGLAFADSMLAAKRARSADFDARGEARCAQEAGQSLETCAVAIARAAGSAAVVVTFPNGFARTLTFEDRQFLRGSATMSGVGTDTDWSLSSGVFSIRVDDQRFELPEALVFGP